MRDLVNWVNCESGESNPLITAICKLDDSDINDWVKWKAYQHQIVVQTNDYYYKVYNEDIKHGSFNLVIRQALADLYNSWGIVWDLHTEITDQILTIERRQKLELPTYDFEQTFNLWRSELSIIEKALKFDNIGLQLSEQLGQRIKLKLVRDCINKNEDYAIYNNHCVLLDDADFFIALVDINNNWLNLPFNIYQIFIDSQEYILAPHNLFNVDVMTNVTEMVNKWWIFDSVKCSGSIKLMLNAMREHSIEDNIKYLCGEPVKLYVEDSTETRKLLNEYL